MYNELGVIFMIKGIPIYKGIEIAKAFVLNDESFDIYNINTDNSNQELERLTNAIGNLREELSPENNNIFKTHLMILDDPEFIGSIKSKIINEKVRADHAIKSIITKWINIFNNMENKYIKERISGISDVGKRLIENLSDINHQSLSDINEEVILIAKNLSPAQIMSLNKNYIKAFVTDIGGEASHSAILAKTIGLPGVTGTKYITEVVKDGDIILVDAFKGQVHINPSDFTINEYLNRRDNLKELRVDSHNLNNNPAITKDHYEIKILSNIERCEDVKTSILNGAEGIGLFRTEYIYMHRKDIPSEEEQFIEYKKILEAFPKKPVTFRTLDIGGDKFLDYLKLPNQLNPYLGIRGVRFSLRDRKIFKTQLKAILRASNFGKAKIMFPMISNIEEVRLSKEILNEAKKDLEYNKIPFDTNIEIGIMVEIPSVAIMANLFAREVDFFSIGTNDLCQYTLGVDRVNEDVASLYRPLNPAIIKLIKQVKDASYAENLDVSLCGEIASNPIAATILLGLGLDQLSMNSLSIPFIKKLIRSLTYRESKEIANKVLTLASEDEIYEYVSAQLKQLGLSDFMDFSNK